MATHPRQKSRLLDLPPEIRIHIWELTIGNNSVHMDCPPITRSYSGSSDPGSRPSPPPHPKWATTLCINPYTTAEQYSQYTRPNYYQTTMQHIQTRLQETGYFSNTDTDTNHLACHDNLIEDKPWYIPDRTYAVCPFRITARGLLRLCRSTVHETTAIIYKCNTFMFWTVQSLARFIQDRTPTQRNLLSAIEVYPYFSQECSKCFYFYERRSWQALLSKDIIDTLSGLKSLHVCLREFQGVHYGLTDDMGRMEIDEMLSLFGMLAGLRGLNDVTVMVGCEDLVYSEIEHGVQRPGDMIYRFGLRREVARRLELVVVERKS